MMNKTRSIPEWDKVDTNFFRTISESPVHKISSELMIIIIVVPYLRKFIKQYKICKITGELIKIFLLKFLYIVVILIYVH